MNHTDLRKKQAAFENNWLNLSEQRAPAEKLRQMFVMTFPVSRISSMTINDYVLGRLNIDNRESFCYWLEKKLDDLGRISGSPAWQYGVYYGEYQKDGKKQYRFMKKWGVNLNEAFLNVKTAISNLLNAARREDIDSIARNPLANKLKGKILSTYYPNRFLNIFADDYLTDTIVHFNLDDTSLPHSAIAKQELLIAFKNHDEVMQRWTVDKFAVFIVDEMRRNFYSADNLDPALEDYKEPRFPPISHLTIELVQTPITGSPPQSTREKIKSRKKGTFEKKARVLKKLGTRAEVIVVYHEKSFLRRHGRGDLEDKVQHVSKSDDSAGYDILSYYLDGRKKYIEVKATKLPPGKAQFYITDHEKWVAEQTIGYSVYVVHGVTTTTPTIWDIGNPFLPVHPKVIMQPTMYTITVE